MDRVVASQQGTPRGSERGVNAAMEERVLPKVVQAAAGLAAQHFATDWFDDGRRAVSVEKVAFALDGHIDAWDGWRRLSQADAMRFGRLLRRRPNQLANAVAASELLIRMIGGGSVPGCTLDADFEESRLIVVDGQTPSLSGYIDEALDVLDRLEARRERTLASAEEGHYATTTRVVGRGTAGDLFATFQYEIRAHHLTVEPPPPKLVDADPMQECIVPLHELRTVAERLDAIPDSSGKRSNHYVDSVDRFAREVRCGSGETVTELDLTAGGLNALLAYPGFGKSVVLVETLACWAVQNRIRIAFVLPTNADVVKTVRGLSAVAKEFRSPGQEPSVIPLMSPNSLYEVAEATARRSGAQDEDPEWAWRELGYACALPAVGTTDAAIDRWQPGREPCARLHSSKVAEKHDRVSAAACPWRPTCGKFRNARAAVTADILVTSHVNLLAGRLHAPVEDGFGVTDRLSIEELILRCYPVVVIDEIDELQRAALGQAGRGLVLDHGGRTNTPLRRFDAEFGAAFGAFHEEVDASVRDDYVMLRYLSENYVSHLTYERLGEVPPDRARMPGPSRYWTVPQRSDNWLAGRLLGIQQAEEVTKDDLEMFRSLFLGEGEARPGEPETFPEIRKLMHAVVAAGPTGRSMLYARTRLDLVLSAFSAPERVKIINRLLRRAFLEQIRRHLHGLMANSAHLLEVRVESAQEIAEALGGYNRWQATPTGPLGRLVFAFRESRDLSGREHARLATAAFGGDPHAYLAGLGDVTALAQAGTRRIVLGLSATSYFPGAPHHHVFVEPKWWVPDRSPGSVTVREAPILLPEGEIARISGLDGARRIEATRTIGRELWTQHLKAELERLRVEDEDRVRVLLATTSYQAAELIAEGLVQAKVGPTEICLAVRPRQDLPIDGAIGEGRWTSLQSDRLEQFPATGAKILIAPLARVQRGVNIIGAGNKSALGSVWLIVRPIPLIDEPAELVAHLQARAFREHRGPSSEPLELLAERRKVSGTFFEEIVKCPPYFQAQPSAVKLSVVAEMVNGAIQLIGRARRGGTCTVLHLVDGAFLDQRVGADFASLLKRLRADWSRKGELERMELYYSSTIKAFFDYADGVGQGARR